MCTSIPEGNGIGFVGSNGSVVGNGLFVEGTVLVNSRRRRCRGSGYEGFERFGSGFGSETCEEGSGVDF